ncbi:hypothetical protein [Streptomyces sp. NBC_00059]|uniref:hypothetical protein n=1 Tax=Streptomyces sp. NBC_00059 TaxID=2975635 RepID=UPI00225A6691|nr:hypothetical protein [Streptomyces sp. NBC_00059]MCX5411135.1 hypothetical protein [Streptomyces sp. NBC_00059]
MRHTRLLVPLLAAGLLTAGCGSDDAGTATGAASGSGKGSSSSAGKSGSGGQASGKDLAVTIAGPQKEVLESGDKGLEITPEPERGAPFTDQVEHKLREQVVRTARVPGKTVADCPDGVTQKASAVSTCTVTYEGAEIPFEVTISDSYREGSFITSYTAEPQKTLLVAKAVYDQFNESYGSGSGRSDASKLSCDEIPVAKAFDFDTDSGYTCQYWSKYGGENGDGGYKTAKITIGKAGYTAPGFEEVD